jgi:hypothetical protein
MINEVVAGHPAARVAQKRKLELFSSKRKRRRPLQDTSTAAVEMTDVIPRAAQDKQV